MTTTRLGAPPAARAGAATVRGRGILVHLRRLRAARQRGPRRDLDLASCRVVAILDDNGTDRRPKESFHALAAAHGAGE